MKHSTRQLLTILLCGLTIFTTTSLLASEETPPEQEQDDGSGGYFKIGYGYKYETSPYHDEVSKGSLYVSGRYQFSNGIFFESHYGANELNQGTTLGYNFYNNENWSFDINFLEGHGDITIGFTFEDPTNLETGREHFNMNRSQTTMIGLRATGIYDNQYGQTSFQTNIAPVSLNDNYDNGVYANAWASHVWQIRNWEVYASAGLTYRNDSMLDYYYEIPEAIIRENFHLPAYHPGAGIDVTLQAGVNYPITENFVFESYYRFTDISDSIMDSPLMNFFGNLPERSENMGEFGILVSYVF